MAETLTLTKDVLAEALARTAGEKGWNYTAAARALGVHRDTIRRQVKDLGLQAPERAAKLAADALTDDEKLKLSAENRELRSTIKRLMSERAENSALEENLSRLEGLSLKPPSWILRSGDKKKDLDTPMLFSSDFQWGETVIPEEVDFINEYNRTVARSRYRTLIEKFCYLAFEHTAKPNYNGCIYLRGGDTISGGIHEELAKTDDGSAMECVQSVAEAEIWGIQMLAEKFGQVHVISVPGNHGRSTTKPEHKGYVRSSHDNMATWALEFWFRGRDEYEGAVTFQSPQSGDATWELGRKRYFMTHGDRIGAGGGQGFIGASAPVAKGIYKIRQQQAALGKPVDTVLMGHFHTAMQLQNGYCNGSLIGYNEYAGAKLRVFPEDPCQWAFWAHPRRGIVDQRKIVVAELNEITGMRAAA